MPNRIITNSTPCSSYYEIVGKVNQAKRQKPKKYTRAQLKAIRQTRIKNLRSKK